MDTSDIEKVKNIENIHNDYKQKLSYLRKLRLEIVQEYVSALEKRKIEKIRENLKSINGRP